MTHWPLASSMARFMLSTKRQRRTIVNISVSPGPASEKQLDGLGARVICRAVRQCELDSIRLRTHSSANRGERSEKQVLAILRRHGDDNSGRDTGC
jgi:hypothetical protein